MTAGQDLIHSLSRRRLLRGTLNGAAVTVGLPLLNCLLNGSGTALASGAAISPRFGTWFWGLGTHTKLSTPKTIGRGYEVPPELAPMAKFADKVNLFTNFSMPRDGRPNFCHYSGWVAIRCGDLPDSRTALPGESFDVKIADAIGGGTRFRSLQLSATGSLRDSYSFRNADAVNPPETSALALYQRIFGPEYQDPNSPVFKPDARLMTRKSVLSAVMDDAKGLNGYLGAEDKARLDQYFTSIRELEDRLDLQLRKPPPTLACVKPEPVTRDLPLGLDIAQVRARHRAMTDLLVVALACNQTRVFNMVYSNSASSLIMQGMERTHHIITHEELIEEKSGVQPTHAKFIHAAMEEWAYFLGALDAVKEGERTLLDNTFVLAHTDQEQAKIHTLDGILLMFAGGAGKLKTGLHIDGKGEPVTAIPLTAMHAMGVAVSQFGAKSLATQKVVGEVLA